MLSFCNEHMPGNDIYAVHTGQTDFSYISLSHNFSQLYESGGNSELGMFALNSRLAVVA